MPNTIGAISMGIIFGNNIEYAVWLIVHSRSYNLNQHNTVLYIIYICVYLLKTCYFVHWRHAPTVLISFLRNPYQLKQVFYSLRHVLCMIHIWLSSQFNNSPRSHQFNNSKQVLICMCFMMYLHIVILLHGLYAYWWVFCYIISMPFWVYNASKRTIVHT